MFRVYLEFLFKYLLEAGLVFILIACAVGIAAAFTYMIYDIGFSQGEEHGNKFVISTIVITLLIFISLVVFDVFTLTGSREHKKDIYDLKIKYGIEDYNLTIYDKAGNVVYEKIGYFSYNKNLNQITVTDLITSKVDIITIDDDMEIKVNLKGETK